MTWQELVDRNVELEAENERLKKKVETHKRLLASAVMEIAEQRSPKRRRSRDSRCSY
jgi:regulator of replication initiation timing